MGEGRIIFLLETNESFHVNKVISHWMHGKSQEDLINLGFGWKKLFYSSFPMSGYKYLVLTIEELKSLVIAKKNLSKLVLPMNIKIM